MSQERRHYSRIHFDTEARLYYPGGEHAAQVLDISLKGALLETRPPLPIRQGDAVRLILPLDALGTQIVMEAVIAHVEGEQLGLRCTTIDLDSITHLRRLVELNLGDAALLEREWHHLMAR